MQTKFTDSFLATKDGQLADRILRSCVHCGFCTATCPTYLLTGNELDSPRGRIYLVKELLEENPAAKNPITKIHLDRCLSCQSCETTCPSNVDYHQLLDIGKERLQTSIRTSFFSRLGKTLLLGFISSRVLFSSAVKMGMVFSVLLPGRLARQLPGKDKFTDNPDSSVSHEREVILLGGCVQQSLSPNTNRAAQKILSRLGVGVIELQQESCCGAMHYHSDRREEGLLNAKRLVEQIESIVAEGAESVISTATGCGNFIKTYSEVFRNDPGMLERLSNLEGKIMDIGEFLAKEDLKNLSLSGSTRMAFHSPCTLQHGQGLSGVTEKLLVSLGIQLQPVKDSHLCCGSAGTYSLFQGEIAGALRERKLSALNADKAENIATANIGCQCHLAAGTTTSVKHWVEYIAELLPNQPPG